jgi:hypothetical protein
MQGMQVELLEVGANDMHGALYHSLRQTNHPLSSPKGLNPSSTFSMRHLSLFSLHIHSVCSNLSLTES